MKINKSLDVDLNIISPQKHIRIHEGDVDSVDILIGVSVDDDAVNLDGVTIKYDATINNYLAEQDADGSVVDGKISIPVTQNMTAMSGLLLIDVRMIQSDQILFTQTICATVEKAVVNGSTYIDFDKITIVQRMNALEEKMEHVEDIVENFDTSKLIVSTNRPPSGAPSEADVDLLRVGDTWIQRGDEEIVYKLVRADYHFKPYPTADPYHKFTWQPLNERYGVGNTEPPTTVTYQAVNYSVDGVSWSWFPVQDYFQGDRYAQQITADESTFYICEYASLDSYNTGICDYVWREEGGSGDLSTKMDLAPLNPTAEQIADMPSGQLYSNTSYHKGIIKGGLSFYDTEHIDGIATRTPSVYRVSAMPPWIIPQSDYDVNGDLKVGDYWIVPYNDSENLVKYTFVLTRIHTELVRYSNVKCVHFEWKRVYGSIHGQVDPPQGNIEATLTDYPLSLGIGFTVAAPRPKYAEGDIFVKIEYGSIKRFLYCWASTPRTISTDNYNYSYSLSWVEIPLLSSIPTVPTNISAFTNDSEYLTLGTLPIYDGTVI